MDIINKIKKSRAKETKPRKPRTKEHKPRKPRTKETKPRKPPKQKEIYIDKITLEHIKKYNDLQKK